MYECQENISKIWGTFKFVFNGYHLDKGKWSHKASDSLFMIGRYGLSLLVNNDACITVTNRRQHTYYETDLTKQIWLQLIPPLLNDKNYYLTSWFITIIKLPALTISKHQSSGPRPVKLCSDQQFFSSYLDIYIYCQEFDSDQSIQISFRGLIFCFKQIFKWLLYWFLY